ncbi:hypothetical protein C8Q77DRAFT_1114598 [Trametes polyzona]|nr:hypothetical protein C8Q77DRAFT_1114598 [Trametes polyzona]
MSLPPFGPADPLADTSLSFEFSDLFSPATAPAFHPPSPNPTSVSTSEPDRPSSSQASSSAASSPPPAATTTAAQRKRVRPKIALAPGQPPTARGNDRIRVYVACHECRSRKIRCDGAKPKCVQCQKRPPESGACTYDAAPNRKGYDRRGRAASRAAGPLNQAKRRRTEKGKEVAAPEQSNSSTDDEQTVSQPLPPNATSSSEPTEVETPDHVSPEQSSSSDPQIEEVLEYDPFLWDPENPELFQLPVIPSPPAHEEQEEETPPIPSRPSVQFARETWWDALLAFYATERDVTTQAQALTLSPEQRNKAMRFIVADLRALFQASASWLSFMHLPRFFATLLDPVRRTQMQPSLLMGLLALGVLTQSSEVERGERGRTRALKLLDMAHGALQSSLATGWVDIGLAQAGWVILYFELNTHPAQAWERTQSALLLLDSLVRLFSLTNLDIGRKRIGHGGVGNVGGTAYPLSGQPHVTLNPPTAPVFYPHSQSHIPLMYPSGNFMPQPPSQDQFFPQPNPHAFEQPVTNPFYVSNYPNEDLYASHAPVPPSHTPAGFSGQSHGGGGGNNNTGPPRTHPTGERYKCNCAEYSLGRNWPSVRDFAPSWATTLKWPENMTEAEFQREECRRMIWSSVAMVANMNAYASVNPEGLTETVKLFVREYENFALLTPSESLVLNGNPLQADDVWSLSLRAMLLLQACLRVRASTALSGAQRSEFAVRAWLEIDDIERRMERHTCNMASNYGFQSTEMLFSLRICVSYEFRRFIPQITTAGNALFYKEKAEGWLRYFGSAVDQVWAALRAATPGDKDLDHRKSLFIFWFMSGIKKCLALFDADPTLTLALTVGSRAANYLEYFLLFWPAARLRQIWLALRLKLVQACLQAGQPPPSPEIPAPLPRNHPTFTPSGAAVFPPL